MGNAPWLDSLSDDWVSVPGTPASPVPARSINHSRRSSLQNSPSRIPVPARRSVEPSPTADGKKKVSRPCHFVRREPPTPKTPRTPKTPSKLRSPVPDKTKKSSKPNLPSGRKQQQPTMDTRSPLRSVSNMSSQSLQQDTVQVRPNKRKDKDGTPEWRKRLVHGELHPGEQRDLFAPIGLESVFKPPTPASEKTQQDVIPNMTQPDNLWDFGDSPERSRDIKARKSPLAPTNNDDEDAGDSSVRFPESPIRKSESLNREDSNESPQLSRNGTLEIRKCAGKLHANDGDNHSDSHSDTQLRTASGIEDLRNEGITPITFSRTNTVDGNGTSEVIKSALKQVTNKLEKLSMVPGERPDSRASDSILLNQKVTNATDAFPEDEMLDVTMTLPSRKGGSPLRPFLPNASLHSSQRIIESEALPLSIQDHTRWLIPLLTLDLRQLTLLRRMSQFEETFGELSEDDEPLSPSEEARRKGEIVPLRNDGDNGNITHVGITAMALKRTNRS
ncbi:hypothetical protein EYZ11_001852 [Aspergillus tanneri]|uniref:Uncharacterized protein n=1 Tax=Aspergillus tanneri TaxID=1220188 RepID=A0A4S3JS62_9EURO|nr:hypothetical protein EYZ11_001852 [Aspergillus tanneri]